MSRAALLLAALTLAGAACGSRVDPETPAPTTGPPTTVAPAATTTAAPDEALTVEEALATDDGSDVTVAGALFVADDTVRLCSALAESFPPQCGGAALVVEGLDPSQFDLEEEQGVRWSEGAVEVEGTISGEVLTVR